MKNPNANVYLKIEWKGKSTHSMIEGEYQLCQLVDMAKFMESVADRLASKDSEQQSENPTALVG